MKREEWTPVQLSKKTGGQRGGMVECQRQVPSLGWTSSSRGEIGYNMSSKRPDYEQYESLPDWAQTTLKKHARDPRKLFTRWMNSTHAQTHDALWNAAQTQLVREGRIHNYLRMLWGKKILEWTATPAEALEVMIELNNRFAIDGRNPNSYSGIFWVLGRYDRPGVPNGPFSAPFVI